MSFIKVGELLIEIDKVRNLYSFQDSIYCVVSMDGTVTTFLILQSSLLVSGKMCFFKNNMQSLVSFDKKFY